MNKYNVGIATKRTGEYGIVTVQADWFVVESDKLIFHDNDENVLALFDKGVWNYVVKVGEEKQ